MSEAIDPYQSPAERVIAADAAAADRAEFIKRTYLHLAGAVLAFIALLALFMRMPGVEALAMTMVSGWNWLLVLGAFLGVSMVAERMAQSAVALSTQYLGLAVYVLAEAVIFIPLIYFAAAYGGPDVIPAAALITLLLFGALTGVVFFTRANFSFMRSALYMMGFVALGLIVCSILFGFQLGMVFVVAMIAFACLWILYSTSQILHDYRTDQYVVASLALFASVALLFWYVLRFVWAFSEE